MEAVRAIVADDRRDSIVFWQEPILDLKRTSDEGDGDRLVIRCANHLVTLAVKPSTGIPG